MKYTIKDFNNDFPTDDACLDYIFEHRYNGKDTECPECNKKGFYRVKDRKCYACSWCGYQLHPLADTIFHKSSTSLKDWFFAIFLMSTSKNGVSAKEIERQLGVTYKTAWRMQRQIRKLMSSDADPLQGTVEIDDSYVGGKRRGKRGRGSENKSKVIGMVQRKGNLKAQVVPDLKKNTVEPIIKKNVDKDSTVYTDEFLSYKDLKKHGLDHDVIKHAIKEYVRGKVHTNTIEGFWSQMKRSINGTYHHVSPKHLQLYVDEFSFRYNHRKSETPFFQLLLRQMPMQIF